MQVTFTKTASRRYGVEVERDNYPALAIRSAPGYDAYLPHDLLHFVAEAEFGLDGGVFGNLAAGGSARIFVPVDQRLVAKTWRAERRHKTRLPEGRRSEQLAGLLEHAWAIRRRGAPRPADWDERVAENDVDPARLDSVLLVLDGLAERWHGLDTGGSLTLQWPRRERRRH